MVLIEPTWVASNIADGSLQQTLPYAAAINGDADQFSKAGAYVADQLAHNSITAETVARQIATAAEATRPKTRYVLPAITTGLHYQGARRRRRDQRAGSRRRVQQFGRHVGPLQRDEVASPPHLGEFGGWEQVPVGLPV